MLEHPVTSEPEGVIIEVPHEPKAEATLLQETRERISMLQGHVALPQHVNSLKRLDKDLEAVMYSVSGTDAYGCNDCVHERTEYEQAVRLLSIIQNTAEDLSQVLEGTPDGYHFMARVIEDSSLQMLEDLDEEDFE